MRRLRARSLLVAALLAVTACGGGGGGGVAPVPPGPGTLGTRFALLLSAAGPLQRAGCELVFLDDGTVAVRLAAAAALAANVAACELVRTPAGQGPAVVADLLAGSSLLPAGGPIAVARQTALPSATTNHLLAASAEYSLRLRASGGALLAEGTLAASFAYDLAAPVGPPGTAPVSLLAVQALPTGDVRALLTSAAAGAVPWSGPLTLMPPPAVANQPLFTWADLPSSVADPLTRVFTSASVPVSTHLRLWLWTQPDACTIGLAASLGPALAGTLVHPPFDAFGVLRPTAGPPHPNDLGPRTGLVCRLADLSGLSFALHAPDPGAASLSRLRAVRDVGGTPTASWDFDLTLPGVTVTGPGRVQGTLALTPQRALALLAGQVDLTLHLDSSTQADLHAGRVDQTPVRFFANLGATGVTFGGLDGAAASELTVARADRLQHTTTVAHPAPTAITGVVLTPTGAPPAPTLPAVPVVGQEAVAGEVVITMAVAARLIGDPTGHSLDAFAGAQAAARGPIAPEFRCSAEYIPPFEGVWPDDAVLGSWIMSPDGGLPMACGTFAGTAPGFDPLEGEYHGHDLTIVVHRSGGDVVYEGSVTGDDAQPGLQQIVLVAMDNSGEVVTATHDSYRWPSHGVWRRTDGSMVLTVAGGLIFPEDDVSGSVHHAGLDYAFTSPGHNGANGLDIGTWAAAAPPGWVPPAAGSTSFDIEYRHDLVRIQGLGDFVRMTPQR